MPIINVCQFVYFVQFSVNQMEEISSKVVKNIFKTDI